MKYQIVLLLLISVVQDSIQSRNVIYLENLTTKFNPKYMNLTFDMTPWQNNSKTNRNTQFGEISVWLNTDIQNLFLRYKMVHLKTALTIFDSKFNVCKLFNERILMRFVKPLIEEYLRNSNFKIKCPYKKGHYMIKQTTMPELFIPSFIQRNEEYFSSFDYTSKIDKKVENMFFLSVISEVIEIDD